MLLDSSVDLVDALRLAHLLEPQQLDELTSDLGAHASDPRTLARDLIQRGWLTAFQANLLLQGRGQELLLGSYVLLERIGAGGMGQVFKAKNWKLGRIVALKVIKKERLANEDAVRRFHREIRAAAQLSHPHIVMAYDADEVHGTHFFAMEYVEGTDLAKLVKQHGPIPAPQACDWIRQAALGLQHAHECGLVHRDIKPHNLLLTVQGVVKVLDMGLARLQPVGDDTDLSGTMTGEGVVMGTPDYMAPEQAEESHTVDGRADLYSLGCTLYHLLTGHVPFPGGTLYQKLQKHHVEQPPSIEQERPEVPAAVTEVVRKLMAKRPEDRYQTPAELATVLEAMAVGGFAATPRVGAEGNPTPAIGGGSAAGLTPVEDSLNEVLDFRPTDQTVQKIIADSRSVRVATKRRLLWVVAVASVLFLGFVGVLVAFLGKTPPPSPEPSPPTAAREKPSTFEEWRDEVAGLPAEKQVQAVARRLRERNPGFDGVVKPTIENGAVTQLQFSGNEVTDLSSLRGLPQLTILNCMGSPGRQGKLVDLSPLKGLPLVRLTCGWTKIEDLSPLEGMPLRQLQCAATKVKDLSPLKGMHLLTLNCNGAPIADLSPLKGMRLNILHCMNTKVSDLSPLEGMPLIKLGITGTKVADLSPLKGLPLREIHCNFQSKRDTTILRSLKTLETINGVPAAQFWQDAGSATPSKP
jgi:serine/threonine protein kinase